MRALLDGDIPAARRFAGEAEATGRQAGSANAEMMVWALRIAAARAEGTMSDQVAAIETMLPGAADYPAWHCCLAAVFAEAGRAEPARRSFERVMAAGGVDAVPKDAEWIELLWHLGQAAMLLDEPAAARAVHDALAPYAHLWVVDGIGGACFGPVCDQLARLSAFLTGAVGAPGDSDEDGDRGGRAAEFRREGRLWHLRFRGRRATVADSKGMADLAALLGRPDRTCTSSTWSRRPAAPRPAPPTPEPGPSSTVRPAAPIGNGSPSSKTTSPPPPPTAISDGPSGCGPSGTSSPPSSAPPSASEAGPGSKGTGRNGPARL